MRADATSDPDRSREEVEKTRAELGATVQALAAKTDVKARSRDNALQIKDRLRGRLTDTAETMRGKAAGAVQNARQRADSAGRSAVHKAEPAARSFRDAIGTVQSAARRRPAAFATAAIGAIGVAAVMRQLRLSRRYARR